MFLLMCVTLYGEGSILSPKRTWPRFSDGRFIVFSEQKSNLHKKEVTIERVRGRIHYNTTKFHDSRWLVGMTLVPDDSENSTKMWNRGSLHALVQKLHDKKGWNEKILHRNNTDTLVQCYLRSIFIRQNRLHWIQPVHKQLNGRLQGNKADRHILGRQQECSNQAFVFMYSFFHLVVRTLSWHFKNSTAACLFQKQCSGYSD